MKLDVCGIKDEGEKIRVKYWRTILLLGLAAIPGLMRAQDAFRNPPAPPPEPNPLAVEVPRGGPVWITLSAYSLTSPIIRFRIREGAQNGKLYGTPHMVTATTAVVKYQPPKGAGPGEDRFAYAVQSEAGVSASAEVRITITDKDPLFVAPEAIDFGDVTQGQSARRQLVLQNIGGGLAQGSVRVPEGWSVEGSADYKLGAGAKQSFSLVFQPAEQRAYTGDIEYTGNPERATDLSGEEVPPLEAQTGPLELTGTARAGEIQVRNHTNEALKVRITTGPHLDRGGNGGGACKRNRRDRGPRESWRGRGIGRPSNSGGGGDECEHPGAWRIAGTFREWEGKQPIHRTSLDPGGEPRAHPCCQRPARGDVPDRRESAGCSRAIANARIASGQRG